MGLIVDTSVFMAHVFTDELSGYADRAMQLAGKQGLIQPTIWWYELRNVLLVGLRRNRITTMHLDEVLSDVRRMTIDLDFNHDSHMTITYAREFTLSIYDAAYLEVASRRRIPLATLDKKLKSACQSLGVDTFG